jgi:hypothetical protein
VSPAHPDGEEERMDGWTEGLARALGVEPLSREEVGSLLGVSRDVAHRVERKVTPLAAFLLGEAVGRAEAAGASRVEARETALAALRAVLPAEPAEA